MGSAMMHGTHTRVGGTFDVHLIAYVSYMAHQISVSNMPGVNSIILDLSNKPRSISGIQAAEELV